MFVMLNIFTNFSHFKSVYLNKKSTFNSEGVILPILKNFIIHHSLINIRYSKMD